MREIAVIEAELDIVKAELVETIALAEQLRLRQVELKHEIAQLEAELVATKLGQRQLMQYRRDLSRVVHTPGQGMVGWLAWWSGLVYTHWGAVSCEEAARRGVLTVVVDWSPGLNPQANFGPLEAARKIAEQHGVLLVVRPGYIWPENPFDARSDYVDPPLELVSGHVAQFGDWCKTARHVLAYVLIGFWGKWAEGHGSTGSRNRDYWLEILKACGELLPRGLPRLLRRPDMAVALGYSNPLEAARAGWGIKQLAFLHKDWDAGTDNQGVFATNPMAGRAYRYGFVGVPSALECMGPTGADFDAARDEWPEIEAELFRVGATGYHLWSPGKDFQRLGGIEWMAKYGGARFELTASDLPQQVRPGLNKVKLTVSNYGAGWWYRELWASLTLEQGDRQWAAALEGLRLDAVGPRQEMSFECDWYVPNLTPGFYSVYLGFYPGPEAKKHPGWRRHQLQFGNLAPGGDGGGALGLEVRVV